MHMCVCVCILYICIYNCMNIYICICICTNPLTTVNTIEDASPLNIHPQKKISKPCLEKHSLLTTQ